ncbi:MAG: UPF0280 family protein [Clostridiaceae bacterium]|nr:UPF0280 family protein [Clostridiaceae bacterium]
MGFGAEPRKYRNYIYGKNLVYFAVKVKQTDLYIGAVKNLSKEAGKSIIKYRQLIEDYIRRQPVFLHSLTPIEPLMDAPLIIKNMCNAAKMAGVGPMAAVAGAISMYVAQDLMPYSDELIIENGGDIYLAGSKERIVSIFAGNSKLSGKIGIKLRPEDLPVGICTSSGTVGHSLSFGKADAAVVLSKDACLADATATVAGNIVKTAKDIEPAINRIRKIQGISGILIVVGNDMGAWGRIELTGI